MKTIGLLGGMSWESTVTYYRLLNEGVRERLGGLHSCKIVMNSVEFAPLEERMGRGDWEGIGQALAAAAKSVEAGGADVLLIGTNTMHNVADTVQSAVSIPLLHMADAIAAEAQKLGVTKLGLLGTAFTMERDFITGPLKDKHGLETIVPEENERADVHRIIFDELCRGVIKDESRKRYLEIIDGLVNKGAQAIVLGCTEIGLLIEPKHTDIPLIDTVEAHVNAALAFVMD